MRVLVTGANGYTGIYNVCDDGPLSTTELIRTIAEGLNKPPILFYIPRPIIMRLGKLLNQQTLIEKLWGDFCIDNRRVQDELNWIPPFTTTDALADMCQMMLKDNPS